MKLLPGKEPSEGKSVIFAWKKRRGKLASENTEINSLEVRRKEANSRHVKVTVLWKWSYLYLKMGHVSTCVKAE